MDLAALKLIVSRGESETVELKKSTGQLSRAGETLCAFLNGIGGHVIIGATPEGRVVGQEISDGTLRDVASMLENLEPSLPITIEQVALDERHHLLLLTAPERVEDRPFTYKGRAYVRVGSTTSVMPRERYQQVLLDRAHTRRRWEIEPASGFALSDMDQQEVLRTVRLGMEAGRLPESTGLDIGDILDRLELRRSGRLVNAAVVLFAKAPSVEYSQCHLRLARFKGVDKTEFLDERQLRGHAFALLEEAMLFLRRHLPIAGRIFPGVLERQDEPLFPIPALREAIVNALCHRSYLHPGGAVSIAVFDDRLEVWSEGTLPFGIQASDLKVNHASRPRNPLITSVFYRRGLIEAWGRGTQKITELCVQAGHPEPEFEEVAGSVVVRFLPSGYTPPHRVGHDLTHRQRELLQVVGEKGPIALRDVLAALPSVAQRAARDDLYHLQRLGLVRAEGRGRGAKWILSALSD